MPSLSKTPRDSFVGIVRVIWFSSFKWPGQVLRSTVAVILSDGVPAHAGWSQGFETDDSLARFEQDLADMREFWGPLDLAQWRIPAWEVRSLPANNADPVGNLIRPLFAAHVRSNVSEPRFLAAIENVTQFLGERGADFRRRERSPRCIS